MSRGIPCIRQMEDADCGAACLAMVLGYFDKRVDLRELREMTGAGRDGVTALSIVTAARAYGLRARGVHPGDIFAYALPNDVDIVWWQLALQEGGFSGIPPTLVFDPLALGIGADWGRVSDPNVWV